MEENTNVNNTEEKTATNPGNAEVKEDYNFSENNYKFNYTFSLPSINLDDLNRKLQSLSGANISEDDTKLKDWKKIVEDSIDFYTVGGLYSKRFNDENSQFKQGIEQNGELKSISNLKFKKQEGELRGELAILKVSKLLGLGEVISVPLPHSGIWVTLKPPTEKDLIDFYDTLFREKAILGRATFGLYLSNFSVYIQNKLFDFIVNHIHSINYSDIHKEDLKHYILISDLPILAWGFACSIYPNGFEYARACVNNPEECSYVYKNVINLTKLLWIDNASLSETQKSILFEYRPNKLTIESYRKFIADHSRITPYEFTLKDSIKLRLKTPTIAEYFVDGLNWVNSINNKISNLILESDNEEEAKIELLNLYVKSSALRKFSHYVDYIEIEDNVIIDRDTINSVLEAFSSKDELLDKINKEILKYKENSIIALVGIPEFKCPNCHSNQLKPEETVNTRFTKVIPLDVLNLFFILITLKIAKIRERDV